jgi:hypothetical protein
MCAEPNEIVRCAGAEAATAGAGAVATAGVEERKGSSAAAVRAAFGITVFLRRSALDFSIAGFGAAGGGADGAGAALFFLKRLRNGIFIG